METRTLEPRRGLPHFLLVGGAAMLVAMAWFGLAVVIVKPSQRATERSTP